MGSGSDLISAPELGGCTRAFIIDAYSKYIVGWQTATTLRASLAIDALEMALATRRRRNHERLVHHSDRGGQLRFKGSSQHCLV